MIRSVLKTLLPLAIFVFVAVASITAHAVGGGHDAAGVSQASRGEGLHGQANGSQSPPPPQAGVVDCQPPGPVSAAEQLQVRLILLSDQSAKALFGSRISKSYYVLEIELIDRSSSGVVVTGLTFRDAKGNNIIPVSLREIVAKVPNVLCPKYCHRKIV